MSPAKRARRRARRIARRAPRPALTSACPNRPSDPAASGRAAGERLVGSRRPPRPRHCRGRRGRERRAGDHRGRRVRAAVPGGEHLERRAARVLGARAEGGGRPWVETRLRTGTLGRWGLWQESRDFPASFPGARVAITLLAPEPLGWDAVGSGSQWADQGLEWALDGGLGVDPGRVGARIAWRGEHGVWELLPERPIAVRVESGSDAGGRRGATVVLELAGRERLAAGESATFAFSNPPRLRARARHAAARARASSISRGRARRARRGAGARATRAAMSRPAEWRAGAAELRARLATSLGLDLAAPARAPRVEHGAVLARAGCEIQADPAREPAGLLGHGRRLRAGRRARARSRNRRARADTTARARRGRTRSGATSCWRAELGSRDGDRHVGYRRPAGTDLVHAWNDAAVLVGETISGRRRLGRDARARLPSSRATTSTQGGSGSPACPGAGSSRCSPRRSTAASPRPRPRAT